MKKLAESAAYVVTLILTLFVVLPVCVAVYTAIYVTTYLLSAAITVAAYALLGVPVFVGYWFGRAAAKKVNESRSDVHPIATDAEVEKYFSETTSDRILLVN